MKFYTSFFRAGAKVYVRGYDGNTQFFESHKLTPVHFIIDNNEHSQVQYTSFYGDKIKRIDFDNPWDARNFCKENADMAVFGYPNYEYSKIDELFTEEHDTSKLKTAFIDIETFVGNDQDGNPENYDSFPNIMNPQHAISLITTLIGNNVYVYGLENQWDEDVILGIVKDNYTLDFDDLSFTFKSFENDKLLLLDFMMLIQHHLPDIITGWNSNGFDIPYICGRIENLMGPEAVKRLSPFNMVDSKIVKQKFGKEGKAWTISGIELLDYLEVYKKFELSPRENYKLETICQIELGVGKLEFTGSFQNFYKKSFDKFTAYNILDVLRIRELDKKIAFIEIAAGMAYSSKCVFTDVFRVTRIWDNIIANYCKEQNIYVPTDYNNQRVPYEGAFVKPTIPGKYAVIGSFDVGSLYPNIIVQNNISPERMLPENEFMPCSPKDVIELNDRYQDAFANAVALNATLCANGALFDKSVQGIIPQLVEIYIQKRKTAKKQMSIWGNKLEYARKRLQSFT
jgi:DNA polymerase elongation subunit (family B)